MTQRTAARSAGDLHALLQPAFWRQSFVIFAIAAEFALGLHDLMLSGCAYDSERNVRAEAAALGGTPAEEESVDTSDSEAAVEEVKEVKKRAAAGADRCPL